MKPRRITYVVKVFPKLSETFIAQELAELCRRGVEVRVLSLQRPTEDLRHEFIARAGLEARTSYEPGEFAAIVREFQPELIHAHFATESAAAARELAKTFDLPFTFTAHGYDIRRKPPPDFAERASAASRVVTVSQANQHYLVETFGVPEHHIRVIACGVDTERFRPNGELQPLNQPPMVVCVARHVKVKNLELLLEACAELRHRGVRFRCRLVGDGVCRAELEARRAQLGLEAEVEFAGAAEQEQVLAWWQRASVAALTSVNEGMPLCLMEAAACGVPAVATAVGGVPELVQDGVTGLLTPPGGVADFASALGRLIEQPMLARAMGRAARRRVEERFSLARQVDRLLEMWSEVLR